MTKFMMPKAAGSFLKTACAVAMLVLSFGSGSHAARADVRDYEFELADRQVKHGGGVLVTVRLVHRPSGRLVPDALVFKSRIDMSPDGMGEMTAPLDPMSDLMPGYYQFETDLMMAGDWALSLVAKVPGETGYVQTRLVLTAVP